MITQHTPEPWPEFKKVLNQRFGEPPQMMLDEIDYIRARACVNACAGLSTENLENNILLKDGLHSLNQRIRDAEQKHAELLKAVELAYSALGLPAARGYMEAQHILETAICAAKEST